LAFIKGSWRKSGHRGLSFRGCRAVLFACGCTPTHPFVKAAASSGNRSCLLPGMTPSILLRPSRAATSSQSVLRSALRRVQVPPQTGFAGEGLFRQGRADATGLIVHALFVVSSLRSWRKWYTGFRSVKRRRALLGSNLLRNNRAGWVNNPTCAPVASVRRGRFFLLIHLPSYPSKNPCRKSPGNATPLGPWTIIRRPSMNAPPSSFAEVFSAVDRPLGTVLHASASARRSSPSDASPPPARSSRRGAA
jgi:hypothetical protein